MRTRSDITPDWLTAVLSRALGVDVPVNAVEVSDLGTGQMGALVRVRIDYLGQHGRGPSSVAVKLAAASPSVRTTCAAMGIYEAETYFYREVAHLLGDAVPKCYLAEIDSKATWFTIVMEDFDGRARVGDSRTDSTVDRAAQVVVQLAGLQAAMTTHPGIASRPWLDKAHSERMFASAAAAADSFFERFGDSLDNHHLALFDRFLPHVVDWARSWPQPQTVSHGDFRLDNLMFGVQGRAAPVIILDWQTVKLAPPVLDVAYYLSSSLPARIRDANQRDLLREYHRALTVAGVNGYSFDDCWNDFRRVSPYGMVMTALGARAAQTERGDAMLIAGARNFADFALSLNAVELLP